MDANEGWTIEQYLEYAPRFKQLGVIMIEKSLPQTKIHDSLPYPPIAVCADESCHDTSTLKGLVGKYEMINIKLDKNKHLTEALDLKKAASNQVFK